MNKMTIIVGIVASFLVLCQWFVFVSVRRYWFQNRERIRRRVAYPMLLGFGLVTILAARLEFGSELLPPGTIARQIAAVILFSYIGWVLVLTMFFSVVAAIDSAFKFTDVMSRPTAKLRRSLWIGNQSGCISSGPCGCRREHQLTPQESQVQAPSMSGPEETTQPQRQHPTRRLFLKGAAASGIVTAAGLGTAGIVQAYSQPVVETYELLHPMVIGAARPVTLIHVTDCHFGQFMGPRELQGLVDQLNSLDGDALCLTGDIFHSARTVVEQATPLLAKLKARTLGNFAVLGNHDYYAGEMRSAESLEAAGFTLLRNEWITLKVGSSAIHLGGVDDPWSRRKLPNAFRYYGDVMGAAPAGPGVRIALSHRPDIFPYAARHKIDLVLAGHTHGGQIVVPVPGREKGISVADVVSDYTHGWYEHRASRMYLNRGVGLTFLPWRIKCPPEIAVIQLKPAQAGIKSGSVRKT